MSIEVKNNIPLAPYTTFKVGGNASHFVEVTTEAELIEAVAFAKAHSLRVYILGGGSNVLIDDNGLNGLVIQMACMGIRAEENDDSVTLTVGAGEVLDDVVAHTVAHGWWGIENFSHIPGTVGAVPIQNVGAYGLEAKDVVSFVRVYNMLTQTFEVLDADACDFAYRDSIFKHEEGKKYVVTEVVFTLSKTPCPRITYRDLAHAFADTTPTQIQIREAVMKIRGGKFPDWSAIGTAGSFFKNPIISTEAFETLKVRYPDVPAFVIDESSVKVSLGWILDKALDLKGFQQGNVAMYKDQALVLTAERSATATEIKTFADSVVAKIKNETGIDVEWEVTVIE